MIETILIIFLAVAFIFLLFLNQRNTSSPILIQQQLQELQRTVDAKLGETAKQMNESVREQFRNSQQLIKEINEQISRQMIEATKGVSEVKESSKQVFSVAEQLQNLEKTLRNQKQRGSLGEASLELILLNILPANGYKKQYSFKDGAQVDAVIIAPDGLIPVDAKFSLDNYTRVINCSSEEERVKLEKAFKNDLKKRIEETAKYIRPEEGTLPFAFMFIPAEAIYYDLLVNEIGAVKSNTRSLIDYAYKDKNVIIVSPTTFAAYLQSVLYGFRAFKIEKSAQKIAKKVEGLGRHLKNYEEYYRKVGASLGKTVTNYNAGYKELSKVDKDIFQITGVSNETDPLMIEKPEGEE
jgi:DNA recombination protein RmuC